jgi:ferredoxin
MVMKKPRVLVDKCIGCGICENKCPVKAPAAIIVSPYLESRADADRRDGYGY